MIQRILDIYLLSLLDRGIETPYSLQREGGLSLGASTPSLRRLSAARLIKREDEKSSTNRPRHVYRLTAAGREIARAGWRELLHANRISGDLDEILRVVEMAGHYGAAAKEIADFIQLAADQRNALAMQSAAVVTKPSMPMSYGKMRSRCHAARLQAEAKVLARLATEIAKSHGKKPRPDVPRLAPASRPPHRNRKNK